MICQRCLRRLSARPLSAPSTLPITKSSSFSSTNSRRSSPASPPAATSPSAAQTFSTPLTPSPATSSSPRKPPTKSAAAAKHSASSVRAGTVLKGLNFMKNKPDPVAREDHEYPDWLWTVLERKGKSAADAAGAGTEGDLFAKSKKQRQKAAKAQRKQALLNPGSLAPKIPIYEQSVDLPAGVGGSLEDSLEAVAVRRELTRAMRQKRKATIKEDNFLRSMR